MNIQYLHADEHLLGIPLVLSRFLHHRGMLAASVGECVEFVRGIPHTSWWPVPPRDTLPTPLAYRRPGWSCTPREALGTFHQKRKACFRAILARVSTATAPAVRTPCFREYKGLLAIPRSMAAQRAALPTHTRTWHSRVGLGTSGLSPRRPRPIRGSPTR